jgi:hypothetical protein
MSAIGWKAACAVVLLLVLTTLSQAARQEDPRGQISGVVQDARTRQPLAGANVEVMGLRLGAATDVDGRFTIAGVPAGVHSLKVSQLGHGTQVLTDLVVRPGRVDPVSVRLEPVDLRLEDVVVRPEYFAGRLRTGAVTQEFGREEIRRAPGSAEDASRLVQSLPSVGMGADDQRNDIVARGGNPMENLFLVDGHPIHNLNHFGSQGGTGGPIGLIHVDFLDQVSFSPGGFDARYGDRLSSVMDVRFREGNRERVEGEASLSMAGMGLDAEGPLAGGRGAWLLGARRSYLELLKKQIGYAKAPVMADLGGKASLDLGPGWQLSGLLLSGVNTIRWDVQDDPDQNYNVDQRQTTVAGGLALRRTAAGGRTDDWRLTVNDLRFDHEFSAWNRINQIRNDARETTLGVGWQQGRVGPAWDLGWGLGADLSDSRHEVRLEEMRSVWGDSLPDQRLDLTHRQTRAWALLQTEWRPAPGRSLRAGLRLDHDDDSGDTDLQPRVSLRQDVAPGWALNLAVGLYAQGIPVSWRVQSDDRDAVKSMESRHLQGGVEWRPAEAWLLSLDLFDRRYRHLPVSDLSPRVPLADAGSYYGYSYLGRLESTGRGRSHGVELLVQKKLSRSTYGSLAGSWSVSGYRTEVGPWLPGPFDRRLMGTLIAGWVPNNRWELSLKWRVAGGLPSTPLDEAASALAGDTRLRLEDYQSERLPVYHRLDLRLDHRTHGKRFNLVQFWDIENAYDRKNTAFEYWHHNDGEVKTWYGWRIMPVYGLTIEF